MRHSSIRHTVAVLSTAAVLACFAAAASAAPLNVTILGSGSPVPSSVRFSQSILIEAGKDKLLVDAGRGATIRLTQAGVPLRDVTAIFITHLHTDHVDGLQDLWSTGWVGCRRPGGLAPSRCRSMDRKAPRR